MCFDVKTMYNMGDFPLPEGTFIVVFPTSMLNSWRASGFSGPVTKAEGLENGLYSLKITPSRLPSGQLTVCY